MSILSLLPGGSAQQSIAIGLALLLAVVVIAVVVMGNNEKRAIGGRARNLDQRRQQLKDDLKSSKKRNTRPDNVEMMKGVVKKFHLLQDKEVQKYRNLLIAAGYREKDAIYRLAFAKGVAPFLIGFMAALVLDLRPGTFSTASWEYLAVLMAMYAGLKVPDVVIVNRRNKRWHQIRKALPDALDLLMVCAEAGLTLNAGLERVAKELVVAYPEMSEELALTSIEMGFLPERRTALDNLQKRVDIPEVRGIISVLIQTEKYGTPVAQALRALAGEYRMQRMLRAEQKAARLPAIMTVPMICFILPALFVVLLAPAIIELMKVK